MVSIDECTAARVAAVDAPPDWRAQPAPTGAMGATAGALPPTGHAVFLSYNRENLREAMRLRDWLRDEGLDVFMDNVHLVAGEPWLQRLQQAVAQAHAFVVLLRDGGPRAFVVEEVAWALQRCRHAAVGQAPPLAIFPVCLGEVPEVQALDPRVQALLTFQVTRWPAGQALPTGLLAALRLALPVAQFALQRCPFRGLATFDEADAGWFFGRMREMHEVIDSLGSDPAADGGIDRESPSHRRHTLISGDSGSGKSSLLRAGVLPRLRAGALWPRTGLRLWRVAGPLRPGTKPLDELGRALALALGPPNAGETQRAVIDNSLRGDPGALAGLLVAHLPPDTGLLLIIDQFEELLQSGADRGERRQFDAVLATALQSPACPLYLLGTLRADALPELDALLPQLVRARNRCGVVYTLPRISEAGLRLSIEEPARRAGIDVGEVAELILGEAQVEPGALALVQHALWSLWRSAHRRGPVTRLLRSDHDSAGGLAGMLSRDADAALAEVKAAVGSDAGALQLLRGMTWVGAEDRLFRRRIGQPEAERLAGQGDRACGAKVIALLASWQGADGGHGGGHDGGHEGGHEGAQDGGAAALGMHLPLLVVGNDGGNGSGKHGSQDSDDDTRNTAYVEMVHEMLLRVRDRPGAPAAPHWARLHQTIQQHLGELKLAQRLQADVQIWRRLGPWQRWRRLASFKEQRLYARLPRPADAQARRYLSRSRAKSATLAAAALLPLAYAAVGLDQAARQPDIFPISYAARLPLWMLGLASTPDFVRLPGAVARFDFGCDPARDAVGATGCDGMLPLQRGFSAALSCDMGRHELSFAQFDRYVFSVRRAGASQVAYPAPGEALRGNLPVMEVSRAEAQAYAIWLSAQDGGRHRYRLPLEWEWEYAARAGSAGPYPWGTAPAAGRANHNPGSGSGTLAAQPVTGGQPNAFGLHHMVGNASEWVADDADPAQAAAPSHVWRGGSFGQGPDRVRVAARQASETDMVGDVNTAANIGFRLCRER